MFRTSMMNPPPWTYGRPWRRAGAPGPGDGDIAGTDRDVRLVGRQSVADGSLRSGLPERAAAVDHCGGAPRIDAAGHGRLR